MDVYLIVLRLIHIFAGVYWVGAGLFVILVLTPALRALGPAGMPFMTGMFKYTRFAALFPIASLLTTVAGVLLYIDVSDTFNSDWISSDGGVVLTIGSIAGIAAFLHGATSTGPTTNKVGRLLLELDAQDGPPSDEQMSQLRALQTRLGLSGRISSALTWIALVGMAAARYM